MKLMCSSWELIIKLGYEWATHQVLGFGAGYNIVVVLQNRTAIQYILWPIDHKFNIGSANTQYRVEILTAVAELKPQQLSHARLKFQLQWWSVAQLKVQQWWQSWHFNCSFTVAISTVVAELIFNFSGTIDTSTAVTELILQQCGIIGISTFVAKSSFELQ